MSRQQHLAFSSSRLVFGCLSLQSPRLPFKSKSVSVLLPRQHDELLAHAVRPLHRRTSSGLRSHRSIQVHFLLGVCDNNCQNGLSGGVRPVFVSFISLFIYLAEKKVRKVAQIRSKRRISFPIPSPVSGTAEKSCFRLMNGTQAIQKIPNGQQSAYATGEQPHRAFSHFLTRLLLSNCQ